MIKLSGLALSGASILSMGSAQAFDAKPWLEDLNQSRAAFAEKYANFDWAIFQREVDLSKLFAETWDHRSAAKSEVQAKAAFDRLARQLGDGHVEFQWPIVPAIGGNGSAPVNACADLVGCPVAYSQSARFARTSRR
jgi:hypothetical protein